MPKNLFEFENQLDCVGCGVHGVMIRRGCGGVSSYGVTYFAFCDILFCNGDRSLTHVFELFQSNRTLAEWSICVFNSEKRTGALCVVTGTAQIVRTWAARERRKE